MPRNYRGFLKRQRLVLLGLVLCILSFQLYHYAYLESMDAMVEKSLSSVDLVWLFLNGARYFQLGDPHFVKELPYLWLSFYSLWFYLVYKEARITADQLVVQKVLRAGDRGRWWSRHWFRIQAYNVLVFSLVLVLVLGTNPYIFKGEAGPPINRLYLQANSIPLPPALSGWVLLTRLLVLPSLSVLCMSSTIVALELFTPDKVTSFVLAFVLLFASLFFSNPIFFMNYAMTIRTMDYQGLLGGDGLGIGFLLGWTVITYLIGLGRARKLEFL